MSLTSMRQASSEMDSNGFLEVCMRNILVAGARTILRLFQLLAVGTAWGTPLVLLAVSEPVRGVLPSRVEFVVFGARLLFVVMAPLAAMMGVSMVAAQIKARSRTQEMIAAVLLAMAVVALIVGIESLGRHTSIIFWLVVLLPVYGAFVTAVALWENARLLGAVWSITWAAIVSVLVALLGRSVHGGGAPEGLLLLAALALLFGTSLLAGIVVLVVGGRPAHLTSEKAELVKNLAVIEPLLTPRS